MKRYLNNETGAWYAEGESITIKLEDGSVFSGVPKEKQLKAWGFKEWTPEPVPEMTEEEQVREAKQERMRAIEAELQSMDYLTSKYIDGEDMSAYGDWQGKRKQLREEYRQLEEGLYE